MDSEKAQWHVVTQHASYMLMVFMWICKVVILDLHNGHVDFAD
jgi:hypothetical protein